MASFEQLEWIATLAPAAQTCARLWKVPASVLLAQAAIESEWGASPLAKRNLNFFGIPLVPIRDYAEFTGADSVKPYAKYGSVLDCFAAQAHLLATAPKFDDAMRALTLQADPVNLFLKTLQRCGYSPDPRYADRLAALIAEANLRAFDLSPDPLPPATPVAVH